LQSVAKIKVFCILGRCWK